MDRRYSTVERFAFVLHPLRQSDFTRKYPFLKAVPFRWVEEAFKRVPPRLVSHITGIESAVGAQAEGWFIAVPMTPRVLLETPFEKVLPRIVQAGRMAEELGAGIIGLGAFLKVVGDRGVSVARALRTPVTTGNSYTAGSALQGALLAAARMGIRANEASAVVIGATGAIGSVCARILAKYVAEMTLVARNRERLEVLREEITRTTSANVLVSTDARSAVRQADIVIAVSSATDVLIEPEDLRPGAVVCDVARPRNVSTAVYEKRNDVLVIDGGVIRVPGENVDFGFNFGFPPKHAEACIAETIILALERRYECFTLGADISVEQVEEITRLAHKHGFEVAGFRRFERAIPDEEVEAIRYNAGRTTAVEPPKVFAL